VDEAVRLSTFAGLVVPLGSVIGPLAVLLTRRDRDPFIDQAGRGALNFGTSIAIDGAVVLVAALILSAFPSSSLGWSPGWCWPPWRRQGQPGPYLPVPANPTKPSVPGLLGLSPPLGPKT
jgi:Domain of unknown function (DUF4870)